MYFLKVYSTCSFIILCILFIYRALLENYCMYIHYHHEMCGLTMFGVWSPLTTTKTGCSLQPPLSYPFTDTLGLKQPLIFLSLYICPSWILHKNEVTPLVCYDWLLSLHTCFQSVSCHIMYNTSFLFQWSNTIPLYGYTTFVYPCSLGCLFGLPLLLKHLDQDFYKHSCICFCLNTCFVYLQFCLLILRWVLVCAQIHVYHQTQV